jgi:hypothetical protein
MVAKIGLAKIVQGRFRERRELMDLKFTGNQVFFLNAVIRQPIQFLPLGEAGMITPQGAPTPYKAGPKDRKRVIALKNWIESLMEKDKDKDQFVFPKPDAVIVTRLTKSYVEFLRDMVTFYERVGSLVQWCEVYEGVLSILDGKPADAGIDDLSEILGPAGDEKAPEPAPKAEEKKPAAAAN